MWLNQVEFSEGPARGRVKASPDWQWVHHQWIRRSISRWDFCCFIYVVVCGNSIFGGGNFSPIKFTRKNLYFQIVIKTKISFSNMGYLLWQKYHLPRIFEHLRCIHTYLYQLSTPSFVFVRYHWSIVWMIDECCVCCATAHGKNDEYDNNFVWQILVGAGLLSIAAAHENFLY